MSTEPKQRMTVDDFLVWAADQPGRWEQYDGIPYAMAPERAQHAIIKHRSRTRSSAGSRRQVAGASCYRMA